MDAESSVKQKLEAVYSSCDADERDVLRSLVGLAASAATSAADREPDVEGFARTAPVPNIPPLPGMNPGAFVLAHDLHGSWAVRDH